MIKIESNSNNIKENVNKILRFQCFNITVVEVLLSFYINFFISFNLIIIIVTYIQI